MNNKKHKGFVVIFVLTTLALMGAMLVVLGNCSRTLLYESNTAYLDAASRNLSASGLAWAKYNFKNKSLNLPAGRIPRDVNDMKMSGATVGIDISEPNAIIMKITTHTFISRGNRHLLKTTVFHIQ